MVDSIISINTPESVGELAKEAYEDALKPTCKEIGKITARLPRLINAAFAGVDIWMQTREDKIEQAKLLIAHELKDISPDKIIAPDPYVAIPTLQAISYSMDSDELRNLYATLLAKAMCTDTKNLVHPSYVEIIKQFSPEDALLLSYVFKQKEFPICKVCKINALISDTTIDVAIEAGILPPKEPPTNYKTLGLTDGSLLHEELTPHLICISTLDLSQNKLLQCLQNLSRLGLIELSYNKSCSDISLYDSFQELPEVLKLVNETPKEEHYELALWTGICDITAFGKSFAEICLPE